MDNTTLENLSAVTSSYLQKVYEYVDIQVVSVTSAFPLSEEQEKTLVEVLRKIVNAYEIKLVTDVDKSLLGGFQIKFGSYIIDASLKAQLRQLADQLQISSL